MDQDNNNQAESLEDDSNSLESPFDGNSSNTSNTSVSTVDSNQVPNDSLNNLNDTKQRERKKFFQTFNIYLILFTLVLLVSGVIITIAYLQNKSSSTPTPLKSQTLTQNTLNQLANSDVSVGAPKQVLNVEANAVFAGKVLISNGLQVAGATQINGTLTLSGITVNGIGTFQQLTANNGLTVTGTTSLQGATTISQNLQVNGNGTFNGSLSAGQFTTNNLNLSGDLALEHHLVVTGTQPKSNYNSALGNGGTGSVNGSDTAGNINLNTGTNPTAGCLITISFTTAFAVTPYVLLTPVGASSAGLAYYINRTSNSFSVCDNTPPPAQANISFDYFVIG